MKVTLKNNLLRSTMIAGAIVLGASAPTFMATTAFAQDYTTGAIRGQVLGGVTGTTVSLTSNDRGFTRTTTVGANGEYRFNRLPIGRYTLSVDGEVRNESAAVVVNSVNVYNLNSANADEVVVVGQVRAPISDFSVNQLGLTVDVDELFDKQPLARNLAAVALLAPGTVGGDSAFGNLASIGGSSVAENAYYINGMNITDFRNFVGASAVPFEFYQQIETKTGGYSAEFGRSTGGVVNAVTKSGSNEFHFGVNYYATPDQLREDSPTTFGQTTSAYNELDSTRDQEATVWASGPIVKDRVFFFGLYNAQSYTDVDYSRTVNSTTDGAFGLTGQKSTRKNSDPFYGGKLDVVLTEDHLLEYTYIHDENVREEFLADVTYDAEGELTSEVAIEGSGLQYNGGDVHIAKYTGNITDWLTISALYGEQSIAQTVQSSADTLPVIYDNRTNPLGAVFPGGWINFTTEVGDDTRKLMRFDADLFKNDFFGDHHFRIGMDREELSATNSSQYSGGVYHRYYDGSVCDNFAASLSATAGHTAGSECVRTRKLFSGGEFETIQTALYLQDAWQVTDQLILNVGIRNETFDNKNANGETFTKISDQWAPRLGFAYDLDIAGGSSQLFGSYGRYYLPVATNTNIRLAGAEDYTQEFYDLGSVSSTTFTPTTSSGLWRRDVFGTGEVGETNTLVNENLDPMYVDEFIGGIRYNFENTGSSFFDGWRTSAAFTYRDLASTLEDVAIDAAALKWCDANNYTGCTNIWTGFHQYVLTNPGADLTVSTSIADAQAITGDSTRTAGLIMDLSAADLGYPEATRTYKALELTAKKDFDRFNINASWTISQSKGNYEGAVKSDNGQDDAGLTQDFDQPGLVDGADGLLPNHRAHKIKVFGSYEVTDELNIGGNLRVNSGRKFGCLGLHPTDQFAQAYGNDSHYCGGVLAPRGESLNGDWETRLDLSFAYKPEMVTIGELTLRADVFNVFNTRGSIDIQEYGEDDAGTAYSTYGATSGYQTPRYVRVGFDWEY